jgi:uncharacterized protein with FMN-binding domain
MRRAPYVAGGTLAGLGLVLSFHTHPLRTRVATASPAPTTTPSPTTPSPTEPGPTTPGSTTPATAAAHSATGQDVQYRYGDLQLKVTEVGTRITSISIVADDATDPRSTEINGQALPILQSQAMAAQSANIDGVSGATFTSAAYQQALQSALDSLGG